MTDNVKEIFSKKSLSEIQSKEDKELEEFNLLIQEDLREVLNHYVELNEAGKLDGLLITGVSGSQMRLPNMVYKEDSHLMILNTLADAVKESVSGALYMKYFCQEDFE